MKKLDKRLKYGTYSTAIVIVFIIVAVLVNLVADKLDFKFDLTENSLYSISDETKEILANLDSNVTIYTLYKTGQEPDGVSNIIEQYDEISDKVTVVPKDPNLYPNFAGSYASDTVSVTTNDIIVETDKRFKVVNYDDMFSYSYDENYQQSTDSLDVEPVLTAAIQFVTMENVPAVYYVTGHNEAEIPQYLANQLEAANYKSDKLNLIQQDIPEDCAALLLTSPQVDYSKTEAQKVIDYLANDGRCMVMADYTAENFVNFESIINAYGVEVNNEIAIEGDASKVFQNDPTLIIPSYQEHEIVTDLAEKSYSMLFCIAQPLTEMELKKEGLQIAPILTTSEASYAKSNVQSKSINFENGDRKGPLTLAYAITDSSYTDKEHLTKLVVMGSSSLINDGITQFIGGSNITFVLNSLGWLIDEQDSVYIEPKSLKADALVIDQKQANTIGIVCCIVIPIVIFAFGFVVWMRRRFR